MCDDRKHFLWCPIAPFDRESHINDSDSIPNGVHETPYF